MIDLNSFQQSFTDQAEKFASVSRDAFQVNSQYFDKAASRHSQLFSELNDANTKYVKSLSDGDVLSNLKIINEGYAEDLKGKLTGYVEDSTAALHELQQGLAGVYTTSVAAVVAEQPKASNAKQPTKKAA